MDFFNKLKTLGTAVAKIYGWSKKIEKKVGSKPMVFDVDKEDEVAKEKLLNITPKDKKQEISSLQQSDTLKDEIKNSIRRDIKSGVLDKDKIKSNVKNLIKQKINEKIISKKYDKQELWTFKKVKEKPFQYTKEVFDKDWKEDAEGMIQGIGVLMGLAGKQAVKTIKNPIEEIEGSFNLNKKFITSPQYRDEVYKKYISPIVDEYKEYRHPWQKLAEDPLDVALDASMFWSMGATGAAKAGVISSKTAAKISHPLSIKNISNITKAIIKKMPGGEETIANMTIRWTTRKLLRKEQTSFINTRNKIINEIDDKVKKLTKDEVGLLPQVAEGKMGVPPNASKNFYEALGMMKALADDQARFGLQTKKLTPEVIERRKFQPLAKFLEKEGKLESKIPYEQLSGDALRGQIDTIKKWFPEADPIYMRHFFEDKPKNFSNFFLNTKPVRTFKPGFLKKSYGKEGYIGETSNVTKTQLKTILERQSAENLKWQQNIKLINKLKEHPSVKPLKKGEKPIEGYKIFAPDGMLRFYRGTIDLAEDLKKKINAKTDVWDAFEDSVKAVFPESKTYLGVTKAKLYQAPAAMADELAKLTKSTNPWLKLLYDKPLDAARFSMLALMPRWLTNNIIGNTMFSIISGDVFNPKAFYHYFQAKKAGLFPDDLFGGIHRTERTTSGRLGTAAELPLVKSSVAMHDALLNTKVIGPIMKGVENSVKWGVYKPIKTIGNFSFKNNQFVDDLFKGVGFINKTLKAERKGFLKRMFTNWDDTMKALEKTGKNAGKVDDLVNNVHQWYYHGLNLTDFERRVVRRVIPFYSWMRWSTLYAYRVTTEAPVRANIIKNMSQDFYMMTGQDKLPEWLKGSIPIGNDEDGTVYYLKTSGANIFSGLNDLMSGGIIGAAGKASAPAIKTGVEQWTGREVFMGKKFTKENVQQQFSGSLYKVDPDTGKIVEVPDNVKPGLMENLLRNYFPQYLLMEVALTGGRQRYTAEGLDTILSDLFKDESERKSIVKDIITKQGLEKKKFWNEIGKALGINIQEITPEQEKSRQEALEAATSAIKNKELPILNPRFKELIKERMMQEIIEGTPKEEIRDKVKQWIGINVEELKKIRD